MNQKLQKLLEQCHSDYSEHQIDLEQFSELLITECANVARHNTPDSEELEYGWLIGDKILEHFGLLE
jgi:hypothetical protein